MRTLLFIAAAFAFSGATLLFFVEGHWYGALGWFLVGGYQIVQAIEMTPNDLGEGRERGILREASSGEAATSTDGLGG